MDLKKLLLSEANTRNVLQKTNNISKSPLRKIYENKQLIKEGTTNKEYKLTISTNVSGFATQELTIPSGLKITSSNGIVTIGSDADKFTYNCKTKYFAYVGTKSGMAMSTYTNDDLSKFIENKYCKTDVGGGGSETGDINKNEYKLKNDTIFDDVNSAGHSLKLLKNTTFKKFDEEKLVAETNYQFTNKLSGLVKSKISGKVYYYCKGKNVGKMQPHAYPNRLFYVSSGVLSGILKKLCNVTNSEIGGGNKQPIATTNKKHDLNSKSGEKITIPSGAKIIPNKEKTGVAIKIEEGENQWVFFKCAGGVYIKDKVVYTASDEVLKNRLLKGFCQNKPEETPERPPGSGDAPTIQSQTPTLIKQIQKTIGVVETGKLTDTEIQTIYDKLNPSAPSNTSDSNTSDNRALKNALGGSLDAKPFGFDNKNKIVSEEINRIKEMMGIVLNEQSTVSQPENTPTEKLQELLNSKFSVGLVVDGKMGPKTAQAIINALGKTTPPTPTPSSTNQTSSGTPSETKPTDNTSKEVKPEPLPTF